MMNIKIVERNKLPTKEMVLALLNGEDISEQVLFLYNNYITAASTLKINNVITENVDTYLDEDLLQTIKMNVLMSLPNLRKNIIRHLDVNDEFNIQIR